jgi:fumarylacetoacetase
MQSWIKYDASHHFPLENIPFGAYYLEDGSVNCCTRIGDFIVDLAELFEITKG